jgi:hypothetical protein
MHDAIFAEGIRPKFIALNPVMDERVRVKWAASEARPLAWGGVSPLQWTLKNTSQLAAELTEPDHPVSARKVTRC